MKLSKETIQLFKNYAAINPNLLINPGNKLSTTNATNTIIAEAVVPEKFDHVFGIYDLNEFLGSLSLFEEPELEFDDRYVIIKSGRAAIKYISSSPDLLFVPKNFPEAGNVLAEFTLSSSDLNMISKTSSVLKAPDVCFVGADGELKIVVKDKKNPTGNSFDHVIGETTESFQFNLRVENFKMINDGYDVQIRKNPKYVFAKFLSTSTSRSYFLAVEADSKYKK